LEPFGIHTNFEGFFLLTVACLCRFRRVPCRILCWHQGRLPDAKLSTASGRRPGRLR